MAKPDWIKINPTAGSNNGSFNVVVDENAGASRNGIVTVTGGELSKTVNVTQNEEQETDLTLNFESLIHQNGTRAIQFRIYILAGESMQTLKNIGSINHQLNYPDATKFPISIKFKAKKSKVMIKLSCIVNNILYNDSIANAGGKILKLRANGTVIGQGEILRVRANDTVIGQGEIRATDQTNKCTFTATLVEIGQWSDSNSYVLDYGIDF